MKFVVAKGIQGWGDRLQCLLQAIRYARATGRYLVVDWRDPDWTHTPDVPVDHYFSVKGLRTFSYKDFASFYQHYEHELTVHPEAWRPHMLSKEYHQWLYKPLFKTDGDGERIHAIATFEEPDYPEDVVVYPGTGMRGFVYSDLDRLVPSKWVHDGIVKCFTYYNLIPNRYNVVHLRGGSKEWNGGTVPLESLDKQIKEKWPTREAYFASLDVPPSNEDCVVLTDSFTLGTAWIEYAGHGRMLPDTHIKMSNESGTHKLTPKQLRTAERPVTKEDLNFEMLRDFVVMTNAKRVVSDGLSLFSKMAVNCRESGARFIDIEAVWRI